MTAERPPLHFSRRRFVQGAGVAGLGLLAGCGRWPWQAGPGARVYRVAYLLYGFPDTAALPAPGTPIYDDLLQGLREYGYVEGQNLAMEFRATAQGEQRVRELVAELVQLPVDIIVAWPGAVLPAKQTTNTLPIVFVGGPDPVALGLVASLTRPGGNVTGLPAAVQGGSLYGKQLELLKEAVPGLARVAVLRDPNSAPPGPAGAPLDAAAQALGLQLYPLEVSGPDDLPIAFETATQAHAEGVFFAEDTPLLFRNRAQLANLARQYRLPSMGSFQQYAAVGGLMVYGPNRAALARRAAYYVDRILKGTPPADLPVEQPREFDFVINLQTAQALGLTIPQHVLLQATEVIQ